MKEPDRELAAWLDLYKVKDADEALLDAIVARACAEPRSAAAKGWRRFLRGWAADVALLAAAAMLGFWVGSTSLSASTPVATATKTQVSTNSSNTVDLDKFVFGPNSWKEVSL